MVLTQILSSTTVFNIEEGFWAANHQSDFWRIMWQSNNAENSAVHHWNKLQFKIY